MAANFALAAAGALWLAVTPRAYAQSQDFEPNAQFVEPQPVVRSSLAAQVTTITSRQDVPTAAHAVLGLVIGDSSYSQIVDGPAPRSVDYPFVTGGYLSQASAPLQGVTVEVFATAREMVNRKTALQRIAPEDTFFNGSYSWGSVLLRVNWWVPYFQATAYGENLALALLVLQ